jgi:hypothetical protein
VRKLSLFELYGKPLVKGVDWSGEWTIVAVAVVGLAVAATLMQRREVGR